MNQEQKAKEFEARGYRVTSRRFGLISRIDRPDWIEHMRECQPGAYKSAKPNDEYTCWEDHYRRMYSKDTLEISLSIARKMKNSHREYVGFIDVPSPV